MEGKFVHRQVYVRVLHVQKKIIPEILLILTNAGVQKNSWLPLEFFFYTNTEFKAQHLRSVLCQKGYIVEYWNNKNIWMIGGSTTPLKIEEQALCSWVEQMIVIGARSDALFDGWGTAPQVYKISSELGKNMI